jgi:hypothetical protein
MHVHACSKYGGDKQGVATQFTPRVPVMHNLVLDFRCIMSDFTVLFVNPAQCSRDQSVYAFPLIFHLKGSRKKSLLISISALGVGLDYSHEIYVILHE